jgi:multiple sugar transport system permease protein
MSPPIARAQTRAAWLMLAPALLLIGVFFALPVLAGLVLSLTDFDLYAIADPANARFVGLANYAQVLANPVFWKALGNTFYFVLVGGPLSVLVSLAAALLLSARGVRLPGLFRTIYFMPVVTTLVAVSVVWRYLYHPTYGLLNVVLGAIGLPGVDWLGDPRFAMPAIIILSVWKNFGYNMLIFLAGLQSIPDEMYEAAELDGATWWSRFVHITLPSLAPTFLFVGIITMLGQFQGGPLKATTSVVLLMYEEGFRWWRIGLAAAIAFVLFVIMLIGTFIQLRLQRERGA